MQPPLRLPGNPGHHAIQFYSDSERLCLSVADFLADGLAARQPVVVIATPEHRSLIRGELARRRFEVNRLLDTGQMLIFDAQHTLNQFHSNDRIDAARFRNIVGDVMKQATSGQAECVRAYGEMVNLLWQAGKRQQAVELEILWNNLTGCVRLLADVRVFDGELL